MFSENLKKYILTIMEFEKHENPCEENETCADLNNFLSRQLSKCRELYDAIDEYKRSMHDLESSISLLQVSILTKQIKYNVLAKEEDVVRQKCIKATEVADQMEQELKKLTSTRIGHNFWERLTNNAEYFLSAYTEYSSAKLSKDIEWYRQEFEKLQHELSMQSKELERLKVENGLNSSISKVAKEKWQTVASLSDIMLRNSNKTNNDVQKIKIARQTLMELEEELNRKRTALKYI